jgi:hypothetical protein
MSSAIALWILCAAVAPAPERPLAGDVINGEALLKRSGGEVKVDGAWINASVDEQILVKLQQGSDGFPLIQSDNVLDRWDVLATLRAKNSDLRDLAMGADTVLVMTTKLDEDALKRLAERAKISRADTEGRVFGLFTVGGGKKNGELTYVAEKDNKKRDKLKKNAKVGYVVFIKVPSFRGGHYEAAFAIDKDMRIQRVAVRAPDGTAPADVNQAAARFVGKGARGQYVALKAGGAGKVIAELERPLSDAVLLAAESVYMFEAAESDYFAFD